MNIYTRGRETKGGIDSYLGGLITTGRYILSRGRRFSFFRRHLLGQNQTNRTDWSAFQLWQRPRKNNATQIRRRITINSLSQSDAFGKSNHTAQPPSFIVESTGSGTTGGPQKKTRAATRAAELAARSPEMSTPYSAMLQL